MLEEIGGRNFDILLLEKWVSGIFLKIMGNCELKKILLAFPIPRNSTSWTEDIIIIQRIGREICSKDCFY